MAKYFLYNFKDKLENTNKIIDTEYLKDYQFIDFGNNGRYSYKEILQTFYKNTNEKLITKFITDEYVEGDNRVRYKILTKIFEENHFLIVMFLVRQKYDYENKERADKYGCEYEDLEKGLHVNYYEEFAERFCDDDIVCKFILFKNKLGRYSCKYLINNNREIKEDRVECDGFIDFSIENSKNEYFKRNNELNIIKSLAVNFGSYLLLHKDYEILNEFKKYSLKNAVPHGSYPFGSNNLDMNNYDPDYEEYRVNRRERWLEDHMDEAYEDGYR